MVTTRPEYVTTKTALSLHNPLFLFTFCLTCIVKVRCFKISSQPSSLLYNALSVILLPSYTPLSFLPCLYSARAWRMAIANVWHPSNAMSSASSDYSARSESANSNNNGMAFRGPPRTPTTNENGSHIRPVDALGGMLRTTTETGDIGQFAIRPSRVPQPFGAPRSSGNTFTSNTPQFQWAPHGGGPVDDDRRCLPSYARDATSEIVSLYETPSQKAQSRIFDDPEHRSFSMTQTSTSFSPYIPNHKSYTSLRSQNQKDANSLLQRSHSPFAYPTRLRRPGFRPSSPALSDGGRLDYRRRMEIERVPYVSLTCFPSSYTGSFNSLLAISPDKRQGEK